MLVVHSAVQFSNIAALIVENQLMLLVCKRCKG